MAALGFVAPLAVALVGPLVGQTLDGIPRSAGLRVAIIGQSCLIIAGGVASMNPLFPTRSVSQVCLALGGSSFKLLSQAHALVKCTLHTLIHG